MSGEFLINYEVAPRTQALRAYFVVPGESDGASTPVLHRRSLEKFRKIFTTSSEQYSTWTGSHGFETDYIVPYMYQNADMHETTPPRIVATTRLNLRMFGDRDGVYPQLSFGDNSYWRDINYPSDNGYPGLFSVNIRPANNQNKKMRMEILDVMNWGHESAKGLDAGKTGDPFRTETRYTFFPGVDTLWQKATKNTYEIDEEWWSKRRNGSIYTQLNWRTNAYSVAEYNAPLNEYDIARAGLLFNRFWEVLENIEKNASENPRKDYLARRLAQIAASKSNFVENSIERTVDAYSHLVGEKTLRDVTNTITIRDGYWPTLDLRVPEHREMLEKLKPNADGTYNSQPEYFVLDDIEGLFNPKWPD